VRLLRHDILQFDCLLDQTKKAIVKTLLHRVDTIFLPFLKC